MKHSFNTFTVPCEKSKIVSFTSSRMKNTDVSSAQSAFPVKLICYIAFGSAWPAYCLLKVLQLFRSVFP